MWRNDPRPPRRPSSASGMPTCSPSVTMTSYRCRLRKPNQPSSTPASERPVHDLCRRRPCNRRHGDVDEVGVGRLARSRRSRPVAGARRDLRVEVRGYGTGHGQQDRTTVTHRPATSTTTIDQPGSSTVNDPSTTSICAGGTGSISDALRSSVYTPPESANPSSGPPVKVTAASTGSPPDSAS